MYNKLPPPSHQPLGIHTRLYNPECNIKEQHLFEMSEEQQFERDLKELKAKTTTFESFINKLESFYDDGKEVIHDGKHPELRASFKNISMLKEILNTEDSTQFLTAIPANSSENLNFMALWIVAFNYLIAYASWINESDEKWSVQTLQEKLNHLKDKKLIDPATFNKLWDKIAVIDLQQSDLRKYLVKLSEENERFQMMLKY